MYCSESRGGYFVRAIAFRNRRIFTDVIKDNE